LESDLKLLAAVTSSAGFAIWYFCRLRGLVFLPASPFGISAGFAARVLPASPLGVRKSSAFPAGLAFLLRLRRDWRRSRPINRWLDGAAQLLRTPSGEAEDFQIAGPKCLQ
jgi:hypothetical protein